MSRRVHAARDLPDELRMAADQLHPNQSMTGLLCPVCGGGRSGERSLGLFRQTSTVMARCFRAGCGWKAAVLHDPAGEDETGPAPYTPRVYSGDLKLPSSGMCNWFLSKYGVAPEVLQKFAREADPLVAYFLAFDPFGGERGGVLRNYNTDYSGPKAITYKHTSAQFIGWYRRPEPEGEDPGPIVLVEDAVSAMRVYQAGGEAVCLFGTNLNRERCREVADWSRGRRVLLALDRDAFSKATHYTKRLRGYLKMMPVLLTKDIKDMTHSAVSELIHG